MRPGIAALALTLLALPAALALGGCDDPFGVEPSIYTDTLRLAAPTAGIDSLPSAIDLAGAVPNVGRWPDRITDANQWDFALRVQSGRVLLRPYPRTQFIFGAGIGFPGEQNFEELGRAPTSRREYADTAVALELGRTYTARSRQYVVGFNQLCVRYAKFKPVALNAAAGTASIAVWTNAYCDDPRLNPDD